MSDIDWQKMHANLLDEIRTVWHKTIDASTFSGLLRILNKHGAGIEWEDTPYGGGVPVVRFSDVKFEEEGVPAFKLFAEVGLTESRSEARRLIKQGGAYVNERRIVKFDEIITKEDIKSGYIYLRAGKNRRKRVLMHDKEIE